MSSSISAQRVYYCEPYSDRFTLKEELLGKVGNYYWVSTITRKKVPRRSMDASSSEERNLAIYNTRMNLVNLIGEATFKGKEPIKEYMVTSYDHFDQVHLLNNGKKQIEVWLQRFESDGQPTEPSRQIGLFPFNEPGNSFMLVRSEDQSRLMLVGFEFNPTGAPRIHTRLFDQDWQPVSERVFRHQWITQPMIQDDYTSFPLEDFNNAPVKLANNGEWLMMSPSRKDKNFLLFHFSATDTSIVCKNILLPGTSEMEDVCLSIDNHNGEVVAGVLSTFHYSSLKNVQVVHYSMASRSFDFDSSYRLTTLGGKRVKNGNLVKENFMAVPGRGFLLMKEYGRPFELDYDQDAFDEGWDPSLLFSTNDIPDRSEGMKRLRFPSPKYGYSRYQLPVNPQYHDRGDLSLYYFPANRKDTCWMGMINQEQVTEMNSPNLSYMVVPLQDKLFFLYNSFVHGQSMYASTTVINQQGELISDEGILFWGLKNTLNFQQSRQMAPDQIVIPYDRYANGNGSVQGRIGFAVVQF
ncbi:MAG: hypothetical protein JST68_06075 [Bacteroidetes bacterium]|nr:hypothetical protein [Bacteroidota bacterium]